MPHLLQVPSEAHLNPPIFLKAHGQFELFSFSLSFKQKVVTLAHSAADMLLALAVEEKERAVIALELLALEDGLQVAVDVLNLQIRAAFWTFLALGQAALAKESFAAIALDGLANDAEADRALELFDIGIQTLESRWVDRNGEFSWLH